MQRASCLLCLLVAGCLSAPPGPLPDGDGGDSPAGDGGAELTPLCPTESIVAHWRFEGELTTLVDSVGGHDGDIVMQPPRAAAGIFGQAAEFRPAPDNGYAVVPDQPGLDLAVGSLEIWVWFNGIGADEAFVSRDAMYNPPTDDNGHLRVRRRADQYVQIRAQDADSEVNLRSEETVPPGRWTRILVNWGGGTVELYVDELHGAPQAIDFGWGNSLRPIVIGADQANAPATGSTGTPRDYLDGLLDEIVLCSQRVTP